MSFSIDGKSWADFRRSSLDYNENFFEDDPLDGYKPRARLYDYSYGQIRDAAKELGIKNVNSSKEERDILDWIRNPRAQAPAPAPAAPVETVAEPETTPTDFDTRLDDILTQNEERTSVLEDTINNQKNDYDTAMKDFMDLMNTRFESLAGDYNNQLSTITSTLGGQIDNLTSQISSYQKSYNPTTVVGTSAKATAFDVPESTAGQLGIKNKGTSQFNRKVRNNLKISGVQL